jgi:neutral ceramidase
MDQLHDSKAGPSQPQPRWRQQASRWRLQAIKATVLVAAVVLGYMAFVRLYHGGLEVNWLWRTINQDGNRNEHESAKGNQYLLGVGKADITGLESKALPGLADH